MRRLSITLAAVLTAASIIALVMGGVAGAKSKNYTALALSTSTAITATGDATTKSGALNKAYRQCDSTAYNDYPDIYTGDCGVVVWVKNGWVAAAFESTLEGPPFDPASPPSYGSGWGQTKADAKFWALDQCESEAGEGCTVDRTDRTRYYNPSVDAIGP